MVDAINVFLFLDLSSLKSSEAALLTRGWDAILGSSSLTPFLYTILLIAKQWVEPMTSWEAAENQLEAWGVFSHVFLIVTAVHPAIYEVCTLVEECRRRTSSSDAVADRFTRRPPPSPPDRV